MSTINRAHVFEKRFRAGYFQLCASLLVLFCLQASARAETKEEKTLREAKELLESIEMGAQDEKGNKENEDNKGKSISLEVLEALLGEHKKIKKIMSCEEILRYDHDSRQFRGAGSLLYPEVVSCCRDIGDFEYCNAVYGQSIVPDFADTDKDGIGDEDEVFFHWDYKDRSSPWPDGDPEIDIDQDGVSNVDEMRLKTDPRNADSDQDGLQDGDEIYNFGTSPRRYDTDGDGLSDAQELNLGTAPHKDDSDLDGVSDTQEIEDRTNPLDEDSDDDGLDDGFEPLIDLDPLNADTDGGGVTDGDEMNGKTDPRDPSDDAPKAKEKVENTSHEISSNSGTSEKGNRYVSVNLPFQQARPLSNLTNARNQNRNRQNRHNDRKAKERGCTKTRNGQGCTKKMRK